MRIGLSLPYTYLSDSNLESDQVFKDNLGSPVDALSGLSEKIDYIELGNFEIDAPPESIVKAVHNVWRAGLKISLHPSLPYTVEGMELPEIYPWLEILLPEINDYQENLMLNLHALAEPSGDVSLLAEKSITNLKWMCQTVLKEKLPINIAVELNRSKGMADPCTTYDEVLYICNQVNSPVLGIGWDIGHTYSNYKQGLIPMVPAETFISKITHTHIHDLGPSGSTHWPLTMGIIPLEEYMGLLRTSNYHGLYILELQPQRFHTRGNSREMIFQSIQKLENIIGI